jgi:hypothetical protein
METILTRFPSKSAMSGAQTGSDVRSVSTSHGKGCPQYGVESCRTCGIATRSGDLRQIWGREAKAVQIVLIETFQRRFTLQKHALWGFGDRESFVAHELHLVGFAAIEIEDDDVIVAVLEPALGHVHGDLLRTFAEVVTV